MTATFPPGADVAEAIIQAVRAHLRGVRGSVEMKALAKRCGLSRSTLYNIRKGHGRPELRAAVAILFAFDQTLAIIPLEPDV